MDNTISNISQNFHQIGVQVPKDIPKTVNKTTENPTQISTSVTETGNGQTDKVEISGGRSETLESNRVTPEDHDAAVAMLDNTKEGIEAQNQNLWQIHNLNQEGLVDLFV